MHLEMDEVKDLEILKYLGGPKVSLTRGKRKDQGQRDRFENVMVLALMTKRP